jgi:hypothetical protein
MAQLTVGMTGTVGPSCATILLITVTMPSMLMSNIHVASKVLMLGFGMCTGVCLLLSLRVEVLGMCVCRSLCWRVAKGLQGEARVFAGDLEVTADRRRVA